MDMIAALEAIRRTWKAANPNSRVESLTDTALAGGS
jgi:hypothetical protein